MYQAHELNGTVIHGTLRPEDLLSAFIDELDTIVEHGISDSPEDVEKVGRAHDLMGDVERAMRATGFFEDFDTVYWAVESLMDMLSEFAPPGHYFGGHEGDGSDFGFWPFPDSMEG